jgi:hypothetical protein
MARATITMIDGEGHLSPTTVLRTFVAGFRPRAFWMELAASPVRRPRRLYAYCANASLLYLAGPCALLTAKTASDCSERLMRIGADYQSIYEWLMNPTNAEAAQKLTKGYSSARAYLESAYTRPSLGTVLFQSVRAEMQHGGLALASLVAMWPICSVLLLIGFDRIFFGKPPQNTSAWLDRMRVVAYSSDTLVWLGIAVTAILYARSPRPPPPVGARELCLVLLPGLIFAGYRVVLGYQWYLKAPSLMPAILSQGIILVGFVVGLAWGL